MDIDALRDRNREGTRAKAPLDISVSRITSDHLRAFAIGAVSFLTLTLLVSAGSLREVDRLTVVATLWLPISRLNEVFSIVNALGGVEASSLLALALAAVLTWRKGVRGLVPLLIVVGILAEILLKLSVPQLLPPRDRSLLLRPNEAFMAPEAGQLYAFPSGNVLRTTFLVLVIARLTPRLRGALVALLPVAAVTQVYAVEHWPSDVIGGLLLGWLLSTVASWIYFGAGASPSGRPNSPSDHGPGEYSREDRARA